MKCYFCEQPSVKQKWFGIPVPVCIKNNYYVCETHLYTDLKYDDLYDKDGNKK